MLYCQLIKCELAIILDHYGSFWDRCLLVSNVSVCPVTNIESIYWLLKLAHLLVLSVYIYIKYWYVWYHPKWMFPKMGCAHGFGILHVKKRQTRHTFTEFKETTNFPVLARSIRALPYSIPNCSRGYPRLELQPWNTDLIQSVWWYYIYIYVWAIWQRNQPYSIKPYNSKPYNSISIWLPCIIILTHIV